MNTQMSRTLVLTLLAGLATACAPAIATNGSWLEGADQGRTFSKLVVVGVSPDYNQRCAFERSLVSDLRSPEVKAIPSCDSMGPGDTLSREAVEQLVRATGADAVLATLLVGSSQAVQEGATRDGKGGGYYKAVDVGYAWGYYGAYGVPVVYGEFETAPSVFTLSGEAVLATNVYETRGATVVYAFNTRAQDLESRASALAVITPAMAAQLRQDGVVP